jgi:hypothetical protein
VPTLTKCEYTTSVTGSKGRRLAAPMQPRPRLPAWHRTRSRRWRYGEPAGAGVSRLRRRRNARRRPLPVRTGAGFRLRGSSSKPGQRAAQPPDRALGMVVGRAWFPGRPLAQFRHRPQAPGQGQGLRGRPAGPPRTLLPDPQGLLEGRHGGRDRLRRRRHPALHRAQGRNGSRCSRTPPNSTPCASCRPPACTTHRRAAQDLRHLGKARLRPDRLPRPVRRHHVPGRTTENVQKAFDEINEMGFDLGGAGPACAPHVLRRRGALRAVLLRRGQGAAHGHQHLPRRHPPSGPALQVQVQVLRLPQRLHELHPAPTWPSSAPGATTSAPTRRWREVVRQARHERAGQRRRQRAARPRPSSSRRSRRRAKDATSPASRSTTPTAWRSTTRTACAACTASTS